LQPIFGLSDPLHQVFERWKMARSRSDDSVAARSRAIAICEQYLDKLPWELTREQGDAFRAFLLTQETTPKTAHDRLTWVKSVLRYAKRDLGIISVQPWEGIDISYPKRGSAPRKRGLMPTFGQSAPSPCTPATNRGATRRLVVMLPIGFRS
jgi:hypothetical protein